MKTDSLYKAFPGRFYVLDENGKPTDNYKDKALFKNTYGIAFFINSATKGRGYLTTFEHSINSSSSIRTPIMYLRWRKQLRGVF